MSSRNIRKSSEGITALFVRRPVLALVVNTLIAVAGLAAFFGVEVRELPDVDRPVISVTTRFEGAAAETVDREITAIIEGSVARVAGVSAISSSSSFGRSRVTIEFRENVNLDSAASDVRDAVGRVQNQLPEDSDLPVIVKADDDAQAIIRLAVTSTNMTVEDMSLLVEDEIIDRFAAVPGVATVQVYGDRAKIFRIDIDQARLASYGLTVGDIRNAVSSIAFDSPAGSLTSTKQDLIVRTTSSVTKPEDFEDLHLAENVRLGEVATVILGPDEGESRLRTNGQTGIGLGIVRQAQSNTLDISAGVQRAVEELQPNLPAGMAISITSDEAIFIQGALNEVVFTLVIAIAVVLLVIYVFLRDWRATLIPGATIPVALIGTLAAIYLAGFSINILTMLALVLATGLVVDDAIVVLENIVRRRNQGMGPRAAAVLGTQEVIFAVIATTATLIAVFLPLSFLPGQAGGLFREFGFVLALSVALSSVVALSLCPMLASRLLTSGEETKDEDGEAERSTGGRIGAVFSRLYERSLRASLDMPAVIVLAAVLFSALAYGLFSTVQTELTPSEDRSSAFMRVSAPQGVSIDYLAGKMLQIEELLAPLRESGEVRSTFSVTGMGGGNSAFLVLTLAPWDERTRSQQEILDEVNALAAQVPGVRAFAFQPNSLGIRGSGSGLQFAVAGSNYERLTDAAMAIIAEMEQDPRFEAPRLTQDATQPQLMVDIDRERAADLGIGINGLGEAIQSLLDGRKVGSIFIDDKSFDVKLLSTTSPINDPTDLENIFIRTGDGRYVPLSTITQLREEAVPPSLNREQQLRVVRITSALASDFPLGAALERAEEIAEPHLPPGSRIIPLAEAATLGETQGSMLLTFGFALVIILLVLAAQFESFVSAIIVMATVPLGLACAVIALLLTGTSLNVYSQIGLVLLVGIMAKNGILMVEFANQLRDRGLGVRDAIEKASLIRLRPVTMTMVSTVVGGLPLVMASGAGAEARIALGWVIVGGLGLSAIATLYLTPVAYLLLGRFVTPKVEEEARLERELTHAATSSKL
ncbi:efflux RND transporter permease subunit [Chelativorans sp. Marseille-P2723]|uniref:efflux RND transporter permease subunit n=1 Tax=Chelativorans sp. Marseille-P2723 TaxID=2709133 RepID=UPI00156E5F4F|nr:efflux RND transporter permease subunit [Chelativorans sp. Marseille-P2723]